MHESIYRGYIPHKDGAPAAPSVGLGAWREPGRRARFGGHKSALCRGGMKPLGTLSQRRPGGTTRTVALAALDDAAIVNTPSVGRLRLNRSCQVAAGPYLLGGLGRSSTHAAR